MNENHPQRLVSLTPHYYHRSFSTKSILTKETSQTHYTHARTKYLSNSPHKVAGGPLVQVQLNRSAVIETLVSTAAPLSKSPLSALSSLVLSQPNNQHRESVPLPRDHNTARRHVILPLALCPLSPAIVLLIVVIIYHPSIKTETNK